MGASCLSQPGSVSITNNSRVNARNIQASSTNTNFQLYVIQHNGCPALLAPGASCNISFYTNAAVTFFLTNILVKGSNTNSTFFDMQAIQCGPQLATLSVSPTTLNLVQSGSAQLVTVTNTSATTAVENLQATIPSSSAIMIDSVNTTCSSALAAGSSCQYSFLPGSLPESNTLISINGTNTTGPATITANVSTVTLNLSPATVTFMVGSTGTVTVSNASTTTAATNLQVDIPSGSTFSVDSSSTCVIGGTIAPSSSCTVVFQASGADNQAISISGDNTNVPQVTVTATSAPLLTITGPTQGLRYVDVDNGIPLQLIISNAPGAAATDLSATLPITRAGAAWGSGATVDTNACQDLQGGDSCAITIDSVGTNVPGEITITGTNGANTLTTWVATYRFGGLVFYKDGGGNLKVAQTTNAANGVVWQTGSVATAVTDNNDGCANTQSIISVIPSGSAASYCTTTVDPGTCSSGSTDWYLPAICELGYGLINGPSDCDPSNENNDLMNLYFFDPASFSANSTLTWSSSENVPGSTAWGQRFDLEMQFGIQTETLNNYNVRCVRSIAGA